MAVDEGGARRRLVQPRQQVHGRRFASAVVAEQRCDLVLVEVELQAFEGMVVAARVDLVEPLDLDADLQAGLRALEDLGVLEVVVVLGLLGSDKLLLAIARDTLVEAT